MLLFARDRTAFLKMYADESATVFKIRSKI